LIQRGSGKSHRTVKKQKRETELESRTHRENRWKKKTNISCAAWPDESNSGDVEAESSGKSVWYPKERD